MDHEPFRRPGRRLMRSSHEKMITGVCGGLAEYFDIDPTLVRIVWLVATFMTGGMAGLAYLFLAVIMPRDRSDWDDDFWRSGRGSSGGMSPRGPVAHL